MKIVVFGGSGRIGSAVARDLAHDPEVEQVGIVGIEHEAMLAARRWIDRPNVVLHVMDVHDRKQVEKLMGHYDAGAVALPDRRTSYKICEFGIEAGLPLVDMLEEYHRRPDLYETEGVEVPSGMTLHGYGDWLHEMAIKRQVIFLDGMGFAPGLSNVTVAEGMRKLDRATSAVARVGGVPEKHAAARRPLRYMVTWAFDHVLREYVIHLEIKRAGRIIEVEAGCELETFRFNRLGKDEVLECAVTPGMPSFLMTRPELKDFAEKTIRWPGHWEAIQTLKDCGLLDLDPVKVRGQDVVPRELLLAVLGPHMRPKDGETDVCVMYNTVRGVKDGRPTKVETFLWDEADKAQGLSAMARVTGFPVAIAVRMLARREIPLHGIVAPEDGITGELYTRFLAELGKRGVRIVEEITPDVP